MTTYVYTSDDGTVVIQVKADSLTEAERKARFTLRNTVFHRQSSRLTLMETREARRGNVVMHG